MTQVHKTKPGVVERLLRRDEAIVATSAALLIALAGLYTVFGVGMNMTALEMTKMARPIGNPMAMGMSPAWSMSYAALIFFMWWIMMIAMMTPSAVPMVLLFTALKKMGPDADRAALLSGFLLAGYLLAWAGFSVTATMLQSGLESAGLSAGAMMTIKSRWFAGAVLIVAGLYQFSRFKNACLSHCRSPAQLLATFNRPGAVGALRMGAIHGAYCLGCCWALMALLFVGGIMNLYWITGLALYVLMEKLAPGGDMIARLTGVVLVLTGTYFLISGF